MKSNWEIKKLGEVCELITCGVAARPKYVDVGVPFLSAKNVKDGKIIWNGYNCVSEQTHKELTKNNKPLLGDILYTRVGSYGEAAVIEGTDEFSVFVSLTLIKVKILAKKSISGSGVGNLNVGTVREFPIPVPPLPEQRRIVAKLNKAFAAIAKTKENAEKNLANSKELFESYLNGMFAKPGNGWEEKKLRDILQKTETISPNLKPEKEFIYIDVSSVSNKTFKIENAGILKGKDAPSRARKLIKTGDIIFATVRPTLRRISIIPDEFNKQVCSTGYFVLRPQKFINSNLLFYFLLTNSFNENMEKLQKGASYPAVTDGEVKEQIITYPKSIVEQKCIVNKLNALSAQTKKLEAIYTQKLADLEELKKSMLQMAFNGEL